MTRFCSLLLCLGVILEVRDLSAADLPVPDVSGFDRPLATFFARYCSDCHADGADEGGFAIGMLNDDLSDHQTFARWEQVFDRVRLGEMPPSDSDQPTTEHRDTFTKILAKPLNQIHAATKATVLRRLNRREYQNTMNDVFGTHLDLESMLPEEARSHEFDNVGEALGLSMVHLQRYMDATKMVLDAAIETSVERPKSQSITGWYKDTREGEKHIGKAWKQLDDGAVVRFSGGGYPTGMMRGTSVNVAGNYRVTLVAYAHQSDQPISFSVGGTSFRPGSEKPIYRFFEAAPDSPKTFEFEAWLEPKYMLAIEPHGIFDTTQYKRKSVDDYKGPGLAIGQVKLEGPLLQEFPSRGHRLLFDDIDRVEIPPRNPRDREKSWYTPRFKIETDDPIQAASRSLRRVAHKAFRRPVSDADVKPYLLLFKDEFNDGDTVEGALRTAVTGMLCSPKFLFFQENEGRLDDHALAVRMSYFLNRTLPDHSLMQVADAGELLNAERLVQQTNRLIRHSHFERFLIDFADSWLDLRELDFTAPDKKLFPEFDVFLRDSMPRETLAFLREIIESNLPIRNLVQSDFAMLNNRLAEHYELPAVEGVEIRKTMLPKDSVRGGLLSQASVLKVTANGTNTSPVMRGAWVMERIQGTTPSPPPPGIPGVEPDIRGATTLRELLDKHRDSSTCVACHSKIDPPGFALECFNPIGGYRDHYRSLGTGTRLKTMVNGRKVNYKQGPDVDASGQFADGYPFDGFREFRDQLAENEPMLAKTFLKKLLTFATGREMGFSDRPEINAMVLKAAKTNYRAKDLLLAAIQSEIFRNK